MGSLVGLTASEMTQCRVRTLLQLAQAAADASCVSS